MLVQSVFHFRALQAMLAAAIACVSAPVAAGDPSSAVQGIANAPPEAQIKIVRILLKDLFGTPEEVRVNFVAACKQRQAPAQHAPKNKSAGPAATVLQGRVAGASKEATLMALCAAPVRSKIEAVLVQETVIAKRAAAAESAADSADKK